MKTSSAQFDMLVTYMEQHGDLSKPTSDPNGRIKTLRHWEQLTAILNSDGSGDTKSTEKWKKVWSDYKNNTKKKAARIHRAAKGTGGGPATTSKLSDLEERVLNLIGAQVATGLAVEEAGLSQQKIVGQTTEQVVFSPQLDLDIEDVVNCSQTRNEPGPSNQSRIVPSLPASATPPVPDVFNEVEVETARSSHHTDSPARAVVASPPQLSVSIEVQDTDMLSPSRDMLQGPREHERLPLTQLLPAMSGQTRRISSQSHVPQVQPPQSGHTTPRRLRATRARGSPHRRLRPPTHTEQASQLFLRSDEEWRKFKIEQHRELMELRREENRIRHEEVKAQEGWQRLASRVIDNLDKLVNKYCDQ